MLYTQVSCITVNIIVQARIESLTKERDESRASAYEQAKNQDEHYQHMYKQFASLKEEAEKVKKEYTKLQEEYEIIKATVYHCRHYIHVHACMYN